MEHVVFFVEAFPSLCEGIMYFFGIVIACAPVGKALTSFLADDGIRISNACCVVDCR